MEIIRDDKRAREKFADRETFCEPIHPGEHLVEDFLKPLGLSQNQIARDLDVPVPRINAICLGKRSITADTALRLAKYFDTSPQFWMGLQATYDLEIEERKQDDRLQRVKVLKRA